MTNKVKFSLNLTVEEIATELTPTVYNLIIQKAYQEGELPDYLTIDTKHSFPNGVDKLHRHKVDITKYHHDINVVDIDFSIISLPVFALAGAVAEQLAESFKAVENSGVSLQFKGWNPCDGCAFCGEATAGAQINDTSENNDGTQYIFMVEKEDIVGDTVNMGDILTITKHAISPNAAPTTEPDKFKVLDFKFIPADHSKVSDTTEVGKRPAEMIGVRTGYQSLATVLALALEQAQNGKGNARHQVGDAHFTEQPICELARMYGVGYNFGQAAKKAHETQQLTSNKAKLAEILGAINYLAAAYIIIDEQDSRDY